MAQDVTFLNADYYGVTAVNLKEVDSNNLARFTDIHETTALAEDVYTGKKFYLANGSEAIGSFVWNWMGDGVELLSEDFYHDSYALEDTDYATWTPATTAQKIIDTANIGTFKADFTTYEYLIRWRCQYNAVYDEGTTMAAATVKELGEIWQALIKRPSSLANIEAANFNGNACLTLATMPLHVYYNTNGTLTHTYSITYGIYPAATAATFSNSTSNTPTVTVKTPTYNARCNSSYFSTTRATQVDQSESIIKRRCDIYRMKIGSTERSLYNSLINFYNNPI